MHINRRAIDEIRLEGFNAEGHPIKILVWSDYVGYRRDTFKRWIKVWVDDEVKLTKSFTGKNIEEPVRFARECIEDFKILNTRIGV